MPDLEKILSEIHTRTAERMLEALNGDEPPSPAMLNAVIRFLKDNDVSMAVEPGTPHAALAEEFSRLDLSCAGLSSYIGEPPLPEAGEA